MQLRLTQIALLFLKLGTIGFGGPAAHIALMEAEVVRRRKWLTHEDFLDLVGATNLIPGPNSTELAIHIGFRQGGFAGLILAGASFIFPAVVIVLVMAWAYVRFGALPQLDLVLRSVKPVIIIVVMQALWGLGKTALKSSMMIAIALASIVLSALGVHELLVLALAGLSGTVQRFTARRATVLSGDLTSLFLFFVKVGSVLFGSGYVLLAFLRADLVERWHWLTSSQLLDAITVGQITPGPVFTTATFVGYLVGGFPGAIVATIGIFLPAFVFVSASGWLIPRIRKSPLAAAMLDGINAGSLALMGVVTWQLVTTAVVDIPTALLAIAAINGLFVLRLNSVWLITGAALAGLAAAAL